MDQEYINLQPTLEGTLVRLRPLQSHDFDELYECASDPKVWEQHPISDRYKKEVFQTFFQEGLASKSAFTVIDPTTGKVIGSSRYYDFNREKRQVTIGYTFLAVNYWGGRYNREVKNLMLRHVFQFVDSVIFEIGKDNIRSRKAIENIGAYLTEKVEDIDQTPHVIYQIDARSFQI